jgi:hypothetical protein
MMNQQFSEPLMIGAIARQATVLAAHAAIGAILAAVIGDLNHGTHKNPATKARSRHLRRPFMQSRLSRAARLQ